MAGLGLSLMALAIVQPVGAADTPATPIAMDSPAGQELLLKPRTRRADYAALVEEVLRRLRLRGHHLGAPPPPSFG
jgi:hypothetical protein